MAKQRILVVEDEWIVAETIRRQLTQRGYQVPAITAEGEEAIERAGELRPDLVLMDIHLIGEMDGIEAARQIRARFDIPALFLTAYADDATLQRAKVTGPLGYLLKPVDEAALHSAIETALYREALERRIRENEARLRDLLDSQTRHERLMLAQSRHAAMGEMLAMVAHQWRQPLTTVGLAVTNILTDLELGPVEEDSLREQLGQIDRQVKYLSKTIDDFRDFFRPSGERRPVRVEELIEQALTLLAKTLERNGIEVARRYGRTAPLPAYPNELLQLFLSLLQNAIEALIGQRAERPRITLGCEERDGTLMVTVADNGGGFSESALERLFDPYFTTKQAANGTGLGLYIAKLIVEKHHRGTLAGENAEGGARFTVTLPRLVDDPGEERTS